MFLDGQAVTEVAHISPVADADHFDQRFGEMRDRLLRICTSLVGPETAQDVVQDTYVRTRERIGQLHDPGRFEAWVTRTAVNLCYNRHQAHRRLRDRLAWLAPSAISPREARDPGLRELIERLPPRERTVIVLYYGHGYRTDEVAALVGTSPVNARSILFRARRRLAEQFREAER